MTAGVALYKLHGVRPLQQREMTMVPATMKNGILRDEWFMSVSRTKLLTQIANFGFVVDRAADEL